MHRTNLSKWWSSLPALLVVVAMPCALAESPTPNATKSRPLFSGMDLMGWTVDGTQTIGEGESAAPVWSVKDGMIHCAGGGFGFLRSDEQFADFTLSLDYRLQAGTNSGVGIRTVVYEDGNKQTRPSRAGYEIQLADDGTTEPSIHGTGAIYRHVAPRSLPAKPAGEWNHLVIECDASRLRVWLNDELIQDYDQRKSKQTRNKPREGFIALQNHGGEVDFRKIEVVEK